MNLLLIFTILTILNVILSTIKSILVVKGGKWISSISSAIYYGYYNIVLIYTVAEFPMWQKCIITAAANIIGVFIVKLLEEKSEKTKIWKIEVTVKNSNDIQSLREFLLKYDIGYNSVGAGKYTVFNIYSKDKQESHNIRLFMKSLQSAKYFVSENRGL
jgi:uncharacterized protein YebE (UPF0316 family)